MVLKDVFEALSLGTPFMFAAATYGLFHWLDRNASAQATRAISGWLRGEAYRRIDVRLAILAAFDRLYSSPLLRVRAFLRSAMFSSIVWIGCVLYGTTDIHLYISGYLFIAGTLAFLSSVIISDYVSLFVVRRCLLLYGDRPFASVFLAAFAGSLVIALSYVAAIGVTLSVVAISYNVVAFYPTLFYRSLKEFVPNPKYDAMMTPALLVHLWLPLTAIGGFLVRLFYPVFRVVEWAQWFLKQGSRHPLRAIGTVAAALVFAVTAIGKAFAAS